MYSMHARMVAYLHKELMFLTVSSGVIPLSKPLLPSSDSLTETLAMIKAVALPSSFETHSFYAHLDETF
jgi:hypothetical protein